MEGMTMSRINSHSSTSSIFLNFEPEISSMEEWPQENPNIFGRKLRKRPTRKPNLIVEENDNDFSNEEEDR